MNLEVAPDPYQYDYGDYYHETEDEKTSFHLPDAFVKPVIGDIKEAKFTLTNLQQFYGKSLICSGSNNITSPNEVWIEYVQDQNYFLGEWSEWTSCSALNPNISNTVSRSRKMPNNKAAFQERYCRCSDVKPLPSPR